MIEVSRLMPVGPDKVWAVLTDGWAYSGWVVGNAHIRKVDATWPAEGSRIHHQAGMWPVQVPDVSTVVAVSPERLLELEARLWVLGRVRVRIVLEPAGEAQTRVRITEEAVSGPASWLPATLQGVVLKPRNAEALARLHDIVIGRTGARER